MVTNGAVRPTRGELVVSGPTKPSLTACDITVESEVTSQRKGPALSVELSSRDTDDA